MKELDVEAECEGQRPCGLEALYISSLLESVQWDGEERAPASYQTIAKRESSVPHRDRARNNESHFSQHRYNFKGARITKMLLISGSCAEGNLAQEAFLLTTFEVILKRFPQFVTSEKREIHLRMPRGVEMSVKQVLHILEGP